MTCRPLTTAASAALSFGTSNPILSSAFARRAIGNAPSPTALRLLGIYHRQITAPRPSISLHFRALKNYPAAPKALEEFLRQRRVDLGLSQRKLAEILAIGISDTAVEKWEKNQNRPTESHRRRIIELLG